MRIPKISSLHLAGIQSIGWSTLAHFLSFGIRAVSILILTHLLPPQAYALFGVAIGVVTILELISDVGIRPALIRHPELDQEEVLGTGWVLGVGRGLLLTLIVWSLSFVYPSFQGSPELGPILLVIGLKPLIHSLQSAYVPILYREMKYRQISTIEVGQTFIATCGSISFAYYWEASVWAIVCGYSLGEVAYVVLSYLVCPWKFPIAWNRKIIAELKSFGNQVFWNTAVMSLWLNIDRLLGLKLVSEIELGLYMLASNLGEFIDKLLMRTMDVYYSMLSQTDGEENRLALHHSLAQKLAKVMMPIMMVGMLLAPLTIWFFLDKKWHDAGFLFGLVFAKLMLRLMSQFYFQLLLNRAEIHLVTSCYVAAFLVQATLLYPLTKGLGVIGLSYSMIISTFVFYSLESLIFRIRFSEKIFAYLMTLACVILGLILLHLLYPLP